MMNSTEVYWQAGFKAGQATRNGDASLARMQREWFSRAKRLESIPDAVTAQEMYNAGYAEAQPQHLR